LKATPKDDDTFLNDEKGCLFLLTAGQLNDKKTRMVLDFTKDLLSKMAAEL
jgi:hypothetical protein